MNKTNKLSKVSDILQTCRNFVYSILYTHFRVIPSTTTQNSNTIAHLALSAHITMIKLSFKLITAYPVICTLTMEFIVSKLSLISISICEHKYTLTISFTLLEFTFIIIFIRPPHFPFALQMSIVKVSFIILTISSSQLSVIMISIITPSTFIYYFKC